MADTDPRVESAKLAERAERYEDMAKYMKEYVEHTKGKVTNDERNLLSVAYKNVVGAKRSSYRVLESLEGKETDSGRKSRITEYRQSVQGEIKGICDEVSELLKGHLTKYAEEKLAEAKEGEGAVEPLAEAVVFFKKMEGDYHRYMAEVTIGPKEKNSPPDGEALGPDHVIGRAEEAYKAAMDASEKLHSTHPVRLGLALNFSVFYYEIKKNPEKACDMAKKAFDSAIAELDSLKEDSYKDSTLIMQLLRDNLTLWTSEETAEGGEEEGKGGEGEED